VVRSRRLRLGRRFWAEVDAMLRACVAQKKAGAIVVETSKKKGTLPRFRGGAA